MAFDAFISGKDNAATLLGIDSISPFVRLIPGGYFRLEHAEYLDRMRRARGELAQPNTSALAQLQRLEKITGTVERRHILVSIVMPTLHSLAARMCEFETRIAVARVGLGLHRYRLQHASAPGTLAMLAPMFLPIVPPDPMTGQPLRYNHSAASVVVYSIGKNNRDDGGVFAPRDEQDDLAWTSAPPKR